VTATTTDIYTPRYEGELQVFDVAASQTLYGGSLVCVKTSDGYVYDGADTAGYKFAGIAERAVDNASGADAAEEVLVRDSGVVELDIAAAAITDIFKPVYLKDNATVAFAAGVTNGVYVGRMVGLVSATRIRVAFGRAEKLIEDLASVASGLGASMIGVQDAAAYFTGTDLETILTAIGVQLGGDDDASFGFAEENVLADDDAIYAALEKIDLYFGDLASVANAEGASLVGINDADAEYTGTDVEAALAELGEMRTYFKRGTIATAAVQTMNATPVELVAAPAAGKYIEVLRIHWWLDFESAAYDAAAAGDTLNAKYTNGSGAAVVDPVAGDAIGAAAADYHTLVSRVAELIPVAAAAIVAHIATGEWYAAAGDSPLKYEVEYRIRDLAFATS